MTPGTPASNASSRLAAMGMGLAGGDPTDQGKQPQMAVHYRPADAPEVACQNCQHFQPPSGCELVAGTIDPNGTCDLYTPITTRGA